MLTKIIKSLPHIAHAALNPEKARVMFAKVRRRFDTHGTLSDADYKKWLRANGQESQVFIRSTYPALADEALAFHTALNERSEKVLAAIPHPMGGGGVMALLYVVTRHLQPETVVETGVAAGFSSASFLAAMAENGKGHLYSSDFPYFRFANAASYIGVMVPDDLRARWDLLLKGDDTNIPDILARVTQVDLLHYDSDKSYIGRQRVLDLLQPKLAPDACIMMDDIQDNCFFHDYVMARPGMPWAVVEYQGKYVGLAGRWR